MRYTFVSIVEAARRDMAATASGRIRLSSFGAAPTRYRTSQRFYRAPCGDDFLAKGTKQSADGQSGDRDPGLVDRLNQRGRWLSERAYVDLVALSQFLPRPASSQTGFGIGLLRGGYLGGTAWWLGFTLPPALLMLLFAYAGGNIANGAGLSALQPRVGERGA